MEKEGDSKGLNPYDLGDIGGIRAVNSNIEETKRNDAFLEVKRRIEKVKSMDGNVNPYDLGQIAYIFEPVNALNRRNF